MPQLGNVNVSETQYTLTVYNDMAQIRSSLNHSYCTRYELRLWPLRKQPSPIVPSRPRVHRYTWQCSRQRIEIYSMVQWQYSYMIYSPKHWYCRWYELRSWPLKKRPTTITQLWCTGSSRCPSWHCSRLRTAIYRCIQWQYSNTKHS